MRITTDCQTFPCLRSLVGLCDVHSVNCYVKARLNVTKLCKAIEEGISLNLVVVNLCLICKGSPCRLPAFDNAFSQAVFLAHGGQYLKNKPYEFLETSASTF